MDSDHNELTNSRTFLCRECSWLAAQTTDVTVCEKCGSEDIAVISGHKKRLLDNTSKTFLFHSRTLVSFVSSEMDPYRFRDFAKNHLRFYDRHSDVLEIAFREFLRTKRSCMHAYKVFLSKKHEDSSLDLDWLITSAVSQYYKHVKRIDSLIIKFGKQNNKKEAHIRKNKGWFLEIDTRGYFYYPPEDIALNDKDFQYHLEKLKNGRDIRFIYHSYKEGVNKAYLEDGDRWFGYAEYQGRKNGVARWETEDRTLKEMTDEIQRRCPHIEIAQAKTKFGGYRVYIASGTDENHSVLTEIADEFRRRYPKDSFYIGRESINPLFPLKRKIRN